MNTGSPETAPEIDPEIVARAAAVLTAGGLVALPTETVYGLGADAANEAAVQRIFAVKQRPAGHPLIVHLADVTQLSRWSTTTDPRVMALAEAFWPGPLTLILPRSDLVAEAVTGGRDTVGVRLPDHPLARAVLRAFGGGVAAPSANRFGHVSPTTAEHVRADLGDAVDLIIDGGPCRVGVESTIIELVGERPVLLRPGGVATAAIEAVLGEPVVDGRAGLSRASGMLRSHYAPAAAVRVVEAADVAWATLDDTTAVILPENVRRLDVGDSVGSAVCLVLPADADGFAEGLYGALRDADARGVAEILVVAPVEGALLPAVLDRLAKAAAPRDGALDRVVDRPAPSR